MGASGVSAGGYDPRTSSRKTTGALVSVQLLRAIAAAVVVFGHAETEASQVQPDLELIGFNFGIGVDIFFIISGFVMWLSTSDRFGSPGASWTFIRRRFFRVVPLYWIYTLGMIAAVFVVPSSLNNADLNLGMVLSSFFFFPLMNTHGEYSPVLALGWTLNYEMFFYALFAFSLIFNKSKGFVVLSCLIFGFVGLWFLVDSGPVLFWGRPIILEFLFGVVMARVYLERGHRSNKYLFLLAMLLSVLSYALLSFSESRVISLGIPSAFFAAGFIFFLPGKLNHFLSGIARFGGDSSYSLYLSHPFTLAIVKIIWLRLDKDFAMPWAYVSAATLVSIFTAYALYLFLERPLLRLR